MARLEKKTSISGKLLTTLSSSRLREARTLAGDGRHAAAIYVGGYSLECLLKAAICRRLGLPGLPVTYHSHDLEALLLHSGLQSNMEAARDVYDSFAKLADLWNPEDAGKNIRYADPKRFGAQDSKAFLGWLTNRRVGVLPWVRKQIST